MQQLKDINEKAEEKPSEDSSETKVFESMGKDGQPYRLYGRWLFGSCSMDNRAYAIHSRLRMRNGADCIEKTMEPGCIKHKRFNRLV